MIITKENRMADIIHMNYLLLSVINRFGIQLGFGDKTVDQICIEHQIETGFFLEIINAFLDQEYFPDRNLQTFSIKLIVEYLLKTHRYYLEEKIPEIETLINRMVNECYSQAENVDVLNQFFTEYKNEVISHTKREDEVVFPHALKIEEAYENSQNSADLINKLKKYSIQDYMSEHDNIEEKLFDLKNIIIKYLPAPKDNILCNKVLTELFNLEKDLSDHSRIEEKVLFPKVVNLEKKLLN